jgi:putative peptidoglycan lipid II flippase
VPTANDPPEASAESAAVGEQERKKLTARAGVVALGTLASRVLGLGRELVTAWLFSRVATDAFFVAFTIPNVLRQLLAEGAVQTAVLPVLTRTRETEGALAARQLFRALRGLSLLILLVVTGLGIAFAPVLVDVFASGSRATPGQYERTVELTRWVFPYIFCMGSAALGVAALNMERRFVVTSFAPGLLNVAFILCSLGLPTLLAQRGHEPALALALGALVGGVLQVVAQWPSLHRIGYLGWPTLNLKLPEVREVLRRMGPTLLGLGVYGIDVVIARSFLSELGVGAQSYFSWAQRLCDFPQGIFVMALQTAALPGLSLLVARRQFDEVRKTFSYGMQLTLFVGLSATFLLVAIAEPLVVLAFQRGEFGAVDSRETARALVAQGVGIWMVAAVRQLVSVYYALGDTRTPVVVAAIDLCVFVVLAFVLRGSLGHVGVSWAVTGASAVQMALLWLLLGSRLRRAGTTRSNSEFIGVLKSALRTTVIAGIAATLAFYTARHLQVGPGAGGWQRALPGFAGAMAFAVALILLGWALRSQELHAIYEPLARRLRRAPS